MNQDQIRATARAVAASALSGRPSLVDSVGEVPDVPELLGQTTTPGPTRRLRKELPR